MAANSSNSRAVALQIMLKLLEKGRSLDDIINSDWYKNLKLESRDLGFARELAYGLCRWYFALLPLLKSRLQKNLRAKDKDVEIILLLGFYQILVLQTDHHAAVNETVNLTKLQKKPWARGLVNALLRGLIRDELKIEIDQAAMDAYPPWLLDRIVKDWQDQSTQVLIAGVTRAPMTLRVDDPQKNLQTVIKSFSDLEFESTTNDSVDSALTLIQPCDVSELPGFDEGHMSVQDAAAQLAAPLLKCEGGMRVLDACAAPGGKTIHLLQHTAGLNLDALDLSEIRLQRVAQNLSRTATEANLLVGDASQPETWFSGELYDRILADVPCSATGVMRRHPDIKLLRRESDILPLVNRQSEILRALWSLLKPGGILLYSTCSIFKDENENQISNFLAQHVDSSELPIDAVSWGQARLHGRQIMPGENNMDGFYYARLCKSVAHD